MRGSLVALGVAVVVAAGVVVVPLVVVDGAVPGTPVADDVPVSTPLPTSEEPAPACAESLVASGSSLARDAVTEVVTALEQECPSMTVNYDPVGGGAGLQQFTSGASAMAVIDRPLTETELGQARVRCQTEQFPFVALTVTVRYHVAGVTDLSLDAPTLAKIFSGAITVWNDPAIAALNPGAALSARPIVVVGRSDETATTTAFQQYLTAAGGWTTGADTTFTGKATQSAQGDSGVLAMVEATEGAIGYLTATDGTRSQVLQLDGTAPDPSAIAETIAGALPASGLTLDPAKLYAGPYPLVLVAYAITCADDPAARDFLLAALSVEDGSTRYVFPADRWADALAAAVQ